MILCNAAKSGRVLTIRYSHRVEVEEMHLCLKTVRNLAKHLKPGFLLLTDLSNLKSMDASCASEVGAIMELCCSHGLAVLKRVIPDRSKDIGFNVISCFHLDPQINTQTYENLAEAISSLLSEPLESVSKDVALV